MAVYTMELRKVCNMYTREEVEKWFKSYNLSDYLTEDEISVIENAGVWTKDKLAKKIVDHFFMREIGYETPALFKHFAIVTMDEIMDKMLPLIYSASIKYNPLENVNITETLSRNINGTGESISNGESTSVGNSNSSSLSIASDTSQGQINKAEILSGKYASATSATENESAARDTTTSNTSSNATSSTNETYTRNKRGNEGIYITNQRMIEEYRNLIVDVDYKVIRQLEPIFMGIF